MPTFKERVSNFYNRSDIVKALSKRRSLKQFFGFEVSTHSAMSPSKVAKKVAPFVRGRILNVGIGAGPLTKALRKKGEVIGVDISPGLLKVAKKRGAEVVEGDAHNLPFKDESFDSAVCIGLLGHLAEPENALREIQRTLKPDSPIVVTVSKDFFSAKQSSKKIERMGGPPFKVYSEEEIHALVETCGFEVIDVERHQIAKYPSELFVYAMKKQEL